MTWITHAPPYTPHASQFTHNLRGACTLLGLAACDVVSKGIAAYVLDPHAPNPDPASVANVQEVLWRIYQDARAAGNCGANGAANQAGMIRQAARMALPIRAVLAYREPMPESAWVDFLRTHVAQATPRPYPVLVQVANGQALSDALGGGQDEPGLQYHAFAILGTMTDASDASKGGYLCCDGDNPAIDSRPVVYSRATLALARPVSLIAFDYVTTPPPPPVDTSARYRAALTTIAATAATALKG